MKKHMFCVQDESRGKTGESLGFKKTEICREGSGDFIQRKLSKMFTGVPEMQEGNSGEKVK